jgi:hypothetical protein
MAYALVTVISLLMYKKLHSSLTCMQYRQTLLQRSEGKVTVLLRFIFGNNLINY